MMRNFLVLFIVCLFAFETLGQTQCPSLSDLPGSCRPSANCSGIVCSNSFGVASLNVDKCSDPLVVDLHWRAEGSPNTVSQRYHVAGPERIHFGSFSGLMSTFSRNTTHLNFTADAIEGGDILLVIIPDVEFPLDPHTCMCESLDNVANSFGFPGVPSSQLNCATDQNCSGVLCTFSGREDDLPIKLEFHPCYESFIVSGANPVSGTTEMDFFNETESRPYYEGGMSVTIHVVLINHNYSMDFQMAISTPVLGDVNLTLIPMSQVILDRSRCGGGLKYYPGISGPITSSPPTQQPPHTPVIPPLTCPSPVRTSPGVSCTLLTNCSGLTCSFNFGKATLLIDKCSDPVTVDLSLSSGFNARYYVGGPVQENVDSVIDSFSSISTSYTRNTTHLNITVTGIFEGDILDVIIPDVEFPLDPHTCMCESLDNVTNSFGFPGLPSSQLNCATDQNCSGVLCTFSGREDDLPIKLEFHPCYESFIMSGANPVSGTTEMDFFNETESRPYYEGGMSVTIHVVLINHNYSMDFQATVSSPLLGNTNFTLIPMSQVILDRSHCGDNIKYYPGSPPTSIVPTVTTVGAQINIVAIAVSVPLLLIVSLVVMVIVIVIVGVVLKRRKRRGEAYTFKRLTDEMEDDGEPEI